MTICYRLTRAEIVGGFFLSLSKSPRILTVVLIVSVWPRFIWFLSERAFSNGLHMGDLISAAEWIAGTFGLLILWILVRAKTGERTLTISSRGILTSIGRVRGDVPWNKVKEVRDTGNHILVVGTSGNAFFIPTRAFDRASHRDQFLAEISRVRGH